MTTDARSAPAPSRDELALQYLDQLQFTPYPVQEQALFAWFGSDEGVLVCAPTGMGKTLIAEAAAFEALKTGSTIYYTTPLIALPYSALNVPVMTSTSEMASFSTLTDRPRLYASCTLTPLRRYATSSARPPRK